MKPGDILGLAFNGILSRKLRSGLTSLGIIIGSAAFVALITLGQTIETEIRETLEDLGTDDLRVLPGVTAPIDGPPGSEAQDLSRSAPLTAADQAAVERLASIIETHGPARATLFVEYRGQSARLPVTGVEPEPWTLMSEPELAEGRIMRGNERGILVMGHDAANGLFDSPIGVNQQVTVEGERFRVAGILKDTGTPDENLYMVREDVWRLADDDEKSLSNIVARMVAEQDEAVVAEQVRQTLLRERGLNAADQDFTISTAADLRARVQEITSSITSFLGSIAAISLLVGGIGIANTMFMTVMERSKQIGILKAVGMKRSEVLQLFLMESSMLGFLGGLFGALLGAVLALLLSTPNPDDPIGLQTADPLIMGGMVAFAVVIGSVAGVIPALRAASVPPMESLQGQ